MCLVTGIYKQQLAADAEGEERSKSGIVHESQKAEDITSLETESTSLVNSSYCML